MAVGWVRVRRLARCARSQEWIKKAQGLGKDRAPAKDSESYRIWKRNLLDHGVVKGLAKGNLLAQV